MPHDVEVGLAAAAVNYAERAWPVFPLRPRDKRPAVARGLHSATTDPERVAAWWAKHPDHNIGLRTGVAFDVLDLDTADALDHLDAAAPDDAGPVVGPMVATAKGVHVYVAPTGAGNRAGLLPGVDWRGAGGYVVAPPSVHPSGAVYTWADGFGPDAPIEPCPTWLAELVRPTMRPQVPAVAPRTVAATRWASTALDAEAGRVAVAAEGTRNDALNRAAFSLGQIVAGGGLDASEVAGRLLLAANRAGLAEAEAVATIASGLKAGAASPRTAA